MKKILLFIFLLTSIYASAQRFDSSALRTGRFIIQARDAEALRQLLSTSDIYDEFLDSLNTKFRKNPKPQGNDNITVDSATRNVYTGISFYLRNTRYEDIASFYSRVDAAIKAVNDGWLQRWMTTADADAANRIQNIRQDGRKRFLGKQ